MFKPNFKITPALSKMLMDIEASRQAVSGLPITLSVLTSLRESARLTSTHYSTQIVGNRLTQEQVEDVIQGGTFSNRERDEREVKDYYKALGFLNLCKKWYEEGFIIQHGQANKSRKYELATKWLELL